MIQKRDRALDGLRGIAAMCVVLSHVAAMQWVPGVDRGPPETWQWALWHLGAPAVDVFLVLSGYVVAGSLMRGRSEYAGYLLSRAIRLYPVAWLAVAAGLALRFSGLTPSLGMTAYLSHLAEELTPGDMIGLTTMIAPIPDVSRINPPLWTLILEMQAAAFIPVLLWVARRNPMAVAICGMFVPFAVAYAMNVGYPLTVTGFFFGVALAAAEDRIPPAPRPLAVLAFFGAALMCRHYLSSDDNLLRVPCAIATAGVIIAIRQGAGRSVLESAVLQKLGLLSYPLYALHWPIMAATTMAFGASVGVPIAAVCSIPLALIASAIVEKFVDRPSTRLSRLVRT